jgi:hypothetical protein
VIDCFCLLFVGHVVGLEVDVDLESNSKEKKEI